MKFNFGREKTPGQHVLRVFSIRDSKIDAFMRPFFAQTTQEGMRIWEDSINQGDTGFSRHPEDYCLFELGTFDPYTGSIEAYIQPKSLGLAAEFIRTPVQQTQPNLPGIQAQ